jgi:predicted tellurium resistance membrane protein TerC
VAFFQILLVSLISDIDNVVILSTLLSKHYFKGIQLYAILLLSVSRTVYVYTLGKFIYLPGFHMIMGVIILFLSVKLVLNEPIPSKKRTPKSKLQIFKIFLLILGTDFLLSMDGIMTIAEISRNLFFIFFGLLIGLAIILFFFPIISVLIQSFPWITLFIAGFMAHIGSQALMKDPFIHEKLNTIRLLYPELNIDNLLADFSMILLILSGLIYKIKSPKKI